MSQEQRELHNATVIFTWEKCMKVNEYYSYDKSEIASLKVSDAGMDFSVLARGDILEGVVSNVDSSVKVSFKELNNKEISFDRNAVKNAYAGEKRRFEVIEATSERLVLRDLGGIGEEISARGMLSAQVDLGMPKLVDGFREANGGGDGDDDDAIKRLSDEDCSELKAEGFTIEDFKAERLVKALARIKANRAAKQESIDSQELKLKDARESVRRQAAKAAADKYAVSEAVAQALYEADLPITDENVSAIIGTIAMSSEVPRMTQNSFAYMVRNELAPSVNNIYRSVYSGSIKRVEISPTDWEAIRPSVEEVVAEAKLAAPDAGVTSEDARQLLEYDIPITEENLIYKKELEELKNNPKDEAEVIAKATRALARGGEAQDAILIPSHESEVRTRISELKVELNLQEIRLLLSGNAKEAAARIGIDSNEDAILLRIDELKEEIRGFYENLADEMDIPRAEWHAAADLAIETQSAIQNIATAPVSLYQATFTVRSEITLEGLSNAATTVKASAIGSYEAARTEIRSDLGDSINKAFGNIDSLLQSEGLELTEANRRAVKILGHNSMAITEQSITDIKYYDSKVTSMIEGMKPAVVMAMIKRGYNPLEDDIDTINAHIKEIKDEEGDSPEEKFSTFLVKLDNAGAISEEARATFIGIYRLLYQIEKSDGAAIGAAIGAGKKLTLKNLLTEARTRQAGRVDEAVDDDTDISATVFTNSITDQISQGYGPQVREAVEYNLRLVSRMSEETDPKVWNEVLTEHDAEAMTLEEAAESIEAAENRNMVSSPSDEAARIRNVMASLSSARSFLKAFGIADSVNNIETVDEMGEDLSLEFAAKAELAETVSDEAKLKEAFEQGAQKAETGYADTLLTEINLLGRGTELKSTLQKYGLLNSFAKHDHYRMRLEGDSPARINLTVIHGAGSAGSVNIEVSTPKYHARAAMELSTGTDGYITVNGQVTFDSADELNAAGDAIMRFKALAHSRGFEAAGVSEGLDRLSPDAYLGRLARIKDSEEDRPSDSKLYMLARTFIEEFI